MFKGWTVRSRLFAMAGLLILLTACLTALSWWGQGQAEERERENNADARRTIELVDTVRLAQVHFKMQVQEWKDLLLRGMDEADYDKYLRAFGQQEQRVRETLAKARVTMETQGLDVSAVDQATGALEELGAKYRDALKAYDRSKIDSAHAVDRQVRGADRPLTAAIDAVVSAVEKHAAETRAARERRASEETTRLRIITALGFLLFLVAAVVLALVIIRSVTAPVGVAVSLAEQIATGNLATRVEDSGADELGQMLGSLGRMSHSLRATIGETRACSNTLASTADEIVGAARRTVQATQQQATSVQETTTSTAELTETVRVTERRAGDVQRLMDRTMETGQGLRRELGEAQNVLGVTQDEMRAIVVSIQGLVASNQQIGEIIENVREVADQTQLLAVNAGIEAAKAGELGRGFSVVATEMKTLADQSKKAAQRIRGIVADVQRGTSEAVRAVETGRERVQEALKPVGAMMPKVEQLTQQVEESGQSVRQIIAIVQQQTVGIDQINQAMKVVQTAVQESVAQNQQLDRTAETLRSQAKQLTDSVASYRL